MAIFTLRRVKYSNCIVIIPFKLNLAGALRANHSSPQSESSIVILSVIQFECHEVAGLNPLRWVLKRSI